MTRFIVVPQWQGSPSARAMRLIDGAEAVADDLPRAATTRVDVPPEAGEALGTGIRRFSTLVRVRDAVTEALGAGSERALVIGGDCSVAVPAVAHAARLAPDMALVWFDAHGDLHTPATSPSGAAAGMALRTILEGDPGAGPAVPPERVVTVGMRELDAPEAAFLDETPLRALTVADLADPAALADAVAATGAASVYVHVDLDVLDPSAIIGVTAPVPFGTTAAVVTAAIAALRQRMPLAGASIAGFAPADRDAAVEDLGTILRVVGALA